MCDNHRFQLPTSSIRVWEIQLNIKILVLVKHGMHSCLGWCKRKFKWFKRTFKRYKLPPNVLEVC